MILTRGTRVLGLAFTIVSVLSFFGGAVVEAQVESGKIVGTVRDASGAVLADAVVTVTETGTNTARKVTTGANGDYVVTELQPGTYKVTVEHGGFKRAEQIPDRYLVYSSPGRAQRELRGLVHQRF